MRDIAQGVPLPSVGRGFSLGMTVRCASIDRPIESHGQNKE